MHAESNKSTTTIAAAANNIDEESEDDDNINTYKLDIAAAQTAVKQRSSDHIITLSTAQLSNNEPHSELSLKTQNSSAERIVQFLSKQHARAEANVNTTTLTTTAPSTVETSAPESTTATRSRKFYEFCHFSQWISFQEHIAEVHHRKGRRLHGLQLPLHPLQIFGWLVLILFGVASYLVLIPSFNATLQGPLYGLITGLYIVHIVSHLTALLIDPADRELRRVHRNDRIVPEFDRCKHSHVIENGRCHLCNIRTSSQRTKHCSVCNKCVGKFDHHCKWLNHCIGSRNYVAFLMCVVSAVIATLVIVAAVIAQIVLYYVQPEWLSFWYAAAPAASSVTLATTATINGYALETGGHVSQLNDSLASEFANITVDAFELPLNFSNASVLLIAAAAADNNNNSNNNFLENVTLTTLASDITTLLSNNESGLLNLSTTVVTQPSLDTTTTANNETSTLDTINNNGTIITIAGIGINDTIFLVLLGFLGLLAAITAGLLLHLCFFHIYISFLGLTTYEYIRNHRQAQEAKAKNMLSTLPNAEAQHFNANNPSKKTNECGQIYFCSSLRNPNDIKAHERQYFETHHAPTASSALHCCANSREYHQTALKTYYMCSLLEESAINTPLSIAHISGSTAAGHDETEPPDLADFKTFHCCSTFAASTTQRKVSAANTKATLVSDLEAAAAALSARRSYLQFTEQCTFCTYRIRSPMLSKRSSAVSTRPTTGSSRTHPALKHELSQVSKTSSAASNPASVEHQRCCMKAISKHQRWRRKWNCCSSVPDSPDVPNDIISALAMRHQHESDIRSASASSKKLNATEIPVHFIKSANGSSGAALYSRPTSPRSVSALKAQARERNSRTWPVARLRHMMRMLNRYRRPRCRHHNTATSGLAAGVGVSGAAEQIKQNQIRPLQLQNHSNGCQHHHHHQQQQNYYDSSSPQPPSSTTTTTSSERSSDMSIYSDTSIITVTPANVQPQTNAIETILPTSVIRDDTCMTYTSPVGITLPPALPPPTRRRIPHTTDLQELAETLGFSAHPSGGNGSPAQRLPALNNVYRRQRRKHFLRTRSPTLSPIHESGLSNPTSPQPCRHNASTNCSPSTAPTTTTTLTTSGIAPAAVINNLCGSTELIRKTSSNSSLHSISSSSSST